MRLATLHTDGGTTAAVHDGRAWRGLDCAHLGEWVRSADRAAFVQRALDDGPVLDDARFTLPVPDPAKVVCTGLNYADHILEMGRELPSHPTLFTKFADSLVADGDEIVIRDSESVDWEAELAIVVGETLTRADEETAARAIAGYTVANDISMRDWQRRTLQWFQGKAWDASTPVGPVVVTPDEVDPTAGLRITCTVDGEVVQDATTDQLVFTAAHLLSYISTFTTLRPGDLVLTGTPGGVGMGMEPPRFLHDGQSVSVEIEGIGALTNTLRIPQPDPERNPS